MRVIFDLLMQGMEISTGMKEITNYFVLENRKVGITAFLHDFIFVLIDFLRGER